MTVNERREARHFSRMNRALVPLLSEYYFANEALARRGGAARLQKARDAIEQFLGMRRKGGSRG